MAGFDELGLRDALVANAREAGLESPSTLQRSVIPVLRRGGNAIIRASSGSGITPSYALALLDRYADTTGTKAVVVVPTNDRAERVATTIARFAHGTNAHVAALTSAWGRVAGANIVVASAEKLLRAIEDSQIKLDEIETVIIDGASNIAKLHGDEIFEKLFSSLPREGQRVFITSELTDSVKRISEAHARKALTFPARPAVDDHTARPVPTSTIRYVVAPEGRKADVIARLAREAGGSIALVARSVQAGHEAERDVRGRGFETQAFSYDEFDRNTAEGTVFAYDAPFTSDQLTGSLRAGDVVVCERNELAHLRALAEEANVRLEAAALPAYEADSLNAFRNEIRRAAREEDLEAQMLVLEPLFAELSPEEVAAAATALLRSRRPVRAESGAARAGVKTFARLFFSVGERDGVRPGDVVGAITGESGIKGDEVGRVDIRDTFSVVEVDSSVADKVIRAMNGTTMKNRALRVDYDRKSSSSSGPRTGGSSKPRGPLKRGGPKREIRREKPR